MTAHPELPGLNDPGLIALVMLLRFQGIGADPAQIRHQCGTKAIGTGDMIRCAKELGLKAREVTSSWPRLAKTPLPAIAVLKDGGYLLCSDIPKNQIVKWQDGKGKSVFMEKSGYLVVVCSPRSAHCAEVDAQICAFKRAGGEERIRAAIGRWPTDWPFSRTSPFAIGCRPIRHSNSSERPAPSRP